MGGESLEPALGQFMQDALRQRPDLLADLARLRAAMPGPCKHRRSCRQKLALQANVQGNIGRINVDRGSYESVEQPHSGIFLRFDWPLYQGGLRENQVRRAQSRCAQAQDELESAGTSALREVARAYDQVETGISQYDAAEALRVASQAAYASTTEAFAHGVGSLTDALNAQTALAASEAEVAKAHSQVLDNAAGLAFAAGELTSSAAAVITPLPP